MAYQALGISASDLKLGADFATDPALKEFMCLAKRARHVFKGQQAGPSCPRFSYTTRQKDQGVGLHKILEPMRAATWAREHPVQSIAIGLGVVGLFVGIGYYLGGK